MSATGLDTKKLAKREYMRQWHKTGKVRGLLCHGCNKALGAFRDSPEILRSAALYVERFMEQL